jgi:hypothetical protein
VIEALQGFWNWLLELTSHFVIPDWGALVALIPIFLLIGVVGPILSLIVLFQIVYFLRRPGAPLAEPPEPVPAQSDALGEPVYPRGEPFCARDRLIYPAGATRCDVCRDELVVRCPKCEVARSASVDTCANCGLVLKLKVQNQIARRAAEPPPGGRAIA